VDYFPDSQLRNELIGRLRDKYITDREDWPHLSEVIYCLTKSYFERTDPIQVTEKELLYFSIGFALEDVLLRISGPSIESVELDGLWLTPDYFALRGGQMDLKTTRMYADEMGRPKRGWPEGWMQQFKAYSYLEWVQKNTNSTLIDSNSDANSVYIVKNELPDTFNYSVGILYLGQPALECGTFKFTQQEILDNWNNLQVRKEIFIDHMDKGVIPEPYVYTEAWACKECKYAPRCRSLTQGR
jgi:hypothetical protein